MMKSRAARRKAARVDCVSAAARMSIFFFSIIIFTGANGPAPRNTGPASYHPATVASP